MRPSRLIRTSGFRLGAFYAVLFSASVLVLFVVIFLITANALRDQLTTNINVEIKLLTAAYDDAGRAGVKKAISARLEAGLRPTLFYTLTGSDGEWFAGNLSSVDRRAGWTEGPVAIREADDDRDKFEAEDWGSRMLSFSMVLPNGDLLVVGEDTYRITEVEEAIVRAFGWGFAITLLFGILGGGLLSMYFLRRIEAINRTARAIIEGNITDRVPTRGSHDEFDQLADNLNEMLDRVQSLMVSLNQVSNDIAHDLRTPLSRLHQRLEEVRINARTMEDYEVAVEQAVSDTDSILMTFSALLRIAQIEAGSRKSKFTTMDLSALFQSIAETYMPVAEDEGLKLESKIEPGIRYLGDHELLTQMLVNLVENSIRHTGKGTQINLSLEERAATPVAVISDSGPGVPEEARTKVFERFVRLERSRSTTGSGLGLSLVAAVAKLHAINISLLDNDPGLKVMLEFPSGTPE